MKTALGAIFGFLAGAILGFAAPLIVFLVFYYISPEENRKQVGQAGTAFAIMMPFTAIVGAGVGTILGANRARTGKWHLNDVEIPELAGPSVSESYGGLEEGAARSLSTERVMWFDRTLEHQNDIDFRRARIGFLNDAIQDYRTMTKKSLRSLPLFIFLSAIIPIIFIPISVYSLYRIYIERTLMRDRLQETTLLWGISIEQDLEELPTSLTYGKARAVNI